jgi:phosphoribosylamine-glycine ligase
MENYKISPTAKDYKRIGEGDTGLNTGGMGLFLQFLCRCCFDGKK